MTVILLFSLSATISPFPNYHKGDTEPAEYIQTHTCAHFHTYTQASRLKEAKTRDQGSAN